MYANGGTGGLYLATKGVPMQAPYRSVEVFLGVFMANIMKTSKTAITGAQQGNRGRRAGKPYAGINGRALAAAVRTNMLSVGQLIASSTNLGAGTTWSVRKIVGHIVRWIHHDLPNSEQLKALRTHECGAVYGITPDLVPEHWEKFLEELEQQILSGDNPKKICAWVEYEIRYVIHPLGDGSGRLATSLAAWVMMAYGEKIPDYTFWDRDQLHRALRQGYNAFEVYYVSTFFLRRRQLIPPIDDLQFANAS